MPAISTLIKRLNVAIDASDRDRIRGLTTQLKNAAQGTKKPLAATVSKKVLNRLRNGRYFEELTGMGEALMQSGVSNPTVKRLYAQGLIDSGNLTSSKLLLDDLARNLPKNSTEYAEAQGLIGRIHKQVFVNLGGSKSAAAKTHLKEAVKKYNQLYRKDVKKNLWHGINTVALLARAKKERISVGKYPRHETIANDILAQIGRKRKEDTWDSVIAAEACLALDDADAALAWSEKFVRGDDVKAFHVGSFERQLREIWQLDPAQPPGSFLLPLLQHAVLHKDGGQVDVDKVVSITKKSKLQRNRTLEKTLGATASVNASWMERLVELGRSVVRVGRNADTGVGSGFVMRGGDLHRSWNDKIVLLTNFHVVSPDGQSGGVPWRNAVITFDKSTTKYLIEKVLWSSPPSPCEMGCPNDGHLDVVIALLDEEIPALNHLEVGKRLPVIETDDLQRVYVIGHPNGGGLAFSIQDNKMLDHQAPLIHYHTPTDPGSSGSPIFNEDLELIGIHHAGSFKAPLLNSKTNPETENTYPANEGIWIQSIKQALGEELSG